MTNISTHSPTISALLVKHLKYRMFEQVTLEMNHKTTTLGLTAIVAAVALTVLAFAVPQQALAGGHHHNGIKVNQQIDQLNQCSGAPPEKPGLVAPPPPRLTICVNQGDNSADIDR